MAKDKDFVIKNGVLVRYKGDDPHVEIPEGVTCIGEDAFASKAIQTVNMPDTITKIGWRAFKECKCLSEVNLSKGLTSIGIDAFAYCSSLTELNIPEGVTSIGNGAFSDCYALSKVSLPDSVMKIGNRAFMHTNVEDIILPSGIEEISEAVFEDCKRLKHIAASDKLKRIGERAFMNCQELTDISIPSTLHDIASGAFYGCKRLANENGLIIINGILMSYYYEDCWFYSFNNYSQFGKERVIKIPEGVWRINDWAFYGNDKIVKVVLPDTLTSIGELAFYDCRNLKDISISTNVTDLSINAFIKCRKLADTDGFLITNNTLIGYYGHSARVEIPEGVKIIGSSIIDFSSCDLIEEIIIPESVNIINENAFSHLRNLKKVIMPKTMDRLGKEVFRDCERLESITIPEGIEILPREAFNRCTKLEELVLPDSLKIIEEEAICNCPSLKNLRIPDGVEAIHRMQFTGCGNLCEISIPETVKEFGESDLKGVQLNVFKMNREFSIVLQHKWGSRDEKLFWKMLNDPSVKTFNSIKTNEYKVALAEKLYPEYEEYGEYLKDNIGAAIKDAVCFNNDELLAYLKDTGFVSLDEYRGYLEIAHEEITKEYENVYNRIKKDLNNQYIRVFELRRMMSDLEKIKNYVDVDDLLKTCLDRIEKAEQKEMESAYTEGLESMDKYGGYAPMTLNEAIKRLKGIRGYKDSDELIKECERRLEDVHNKGVEDAYQKALTVLKEYDGSNRKKLESAIDLLERISGYKDTDLLLRDYYLEYWGYDPYHEK